MLNDSAQRKTNPKREMTHYQNTAVIQHSLHTYSIYNTQSHPLTSFRKTETGFCEV